MTDDRMNELMCPQPSVVVRSLANNPDYVKCPRCWHYTHEGLHNHDGLCDRCCNVMIDAYPEHEATAKIKANFEAQIKKWSSQPNFAANVVAVGR